MWRVSDLLLEVRQIVQDRSGTRYREEDVRRAAQVALSELRRLRPDYFFGTLREPLPDLITADPATPIPVPEFLRGPVTAFTAGWIELADSQFEDDNRAIGLMKLLSGSVMRAPA